MAEGMPYYKPHKTPVESFDESLEDIERQASLLFEEFVRLETPVHSAGYALRAKAEHSDSPVVHGRQFGGDFECCKASDDDLVPDSEIIPKGSSHVPSPGAASPPLDPKIQNLARQMQQAGDALYQQYEGRVEGAQNHLVTFVLENAATLTYDRLCKEIDNMVGRDRNWSNFAMAMCVGRRVVVETSRACSAVSGYFSRYVSQSYSRSMQQAGGMEQFVKSRGHGH